MTPAKSATTDAVLELALCLVVIHVFVVRVFGGLLVPDLVLAGALLAVRAYRNAPGTGLPPALRPGRWLARLRRPGLVLAAGLLVAIAMQHRQEPGLGIDGPLLFAQVRSAVIDHDLDLTNEFRDFVPEKFQHWAEEARKLGQSPDPNAEPGPAMLWSPFFVAAHGLVLLARLLGSKVAADGYTAPYVNAVCLASLFWAFVGVCLAYRIVRGLFPPMLAAVSVVGFWFASPLIWYSVYEPAMPHAPTTAVVGAFVLLWLRLENEPAEARRWIAVAFVGGLLLSTNRYNVYFFVLPALTLLRLLARGGWTRARLRTGALVGLGLLGAFVLAALPFFVLNLRAREGQLFRQQYLWEFTLQNAGSPKVGELLFSSAHGLVSWTPLAGVGVLGLVFLMRRPHERRIAAACFLTLAAGVVLLASSYDWSGGWSFGSRRFTEAFVLFALGLCAVAEALLHAPQVLGLASLGTLVVWNLLLAGQVERGEVPRLGTFSFRGVAERAAHRAYEAVGHPAAFPASWLFAWRYGVSPERFDRLYGHVPLVELRLAMGTEEAEGYLGRGWSRAEEADGVAFRWSDGPDSTVLVPLGRAVDYALRLRGSASRQPAGLPQTIGLAVNGSSIGSVTLTREPVDREVLVPARHWRPGLNEIAFRYAWTVEAREVYRTREDRRLAWRAEAIEITPPRP